MATTICSELPKTSSPEAARAGVRAAFGLAERWELTRAELAILLGLRSTSTLDNWRRKPPASLAPDTLERISYLLHIHRALRQMFPAERGVEWLRRPNETAPFSGRSALAFMLQGRVHHLLDTHRHLQPLASGAF